MLAAPPAKPASGEVSINASIDLIFFFSKYFFRTFFQTSLPGRRQYAADSSAFFGVGGPESIRILSPEGVRIRKQTP